MPEQPGLFPSDAHDEYLLKHVNAVALMPVRGARRITLLGRRLFNVLLHRAQEDGEQDEYQARMHEITSDADYDSNDLAPIRKILRELMSTTVEWQSPSNGEIETWEECVLLSGAGTRKDKRTGAVTVFWRYDSKVRAQLLSPDRYARLSLEAITQLSSHASMALYEICARYVDNPGHKTSRQHWRWWKPVLTGVSGDDTKSEYRFFKRDVIHKAVAEINALTRLEVKGPIEFKERDNRTISDIQFEVRLKDRSTAREKQTPLVKIEPKDLPVIGRAINAGVKQHEVEGLLRKHGAEPLAEAVRELEKRLQMPSEKVGQVLKPGGWLKSTIERRAKEATEQAAPATAQQLTQEDIKKHRAGWTDEWLRRRKEGLRQGFQEDGEQSQQELLESFRQELKTTKQPQILKRLDLSGWQHRMVRETFTKFLGMRVIGNDWDKPTLDDILTIAAELAIGKQ
ncbi:MAG: RepB family plasmid replication initiator protein [Polaromonas sp.]|nr:RepB family plasmid replication initiator protein [Polaromonas sp.]